MKQIRKRLTYANVMSSIAVFLLLGGATAFAAVQLGKNTVGSKQLKQNAVTAAKIKKDAITGAKVKDGSLLSTDFKAGQIPTGPQGPKGEPGAAAPIGGVLPTGKTVVGAYAFGGSGGQPRDSITYGGYVLSSAPTAHYIKEGDPVPAGCAGGTVTNPKAAPGNLCIFEGENVGSSENRGFVNPSDDEVDSVLPFGAGVYGSCASSCFVEGTWAVTAS